MFFDENDPSDVTPAKALENARELYAQLKSGSPPFSGPVMIRDIVYYLSQADPHRPGHVDYAQLEVESGFSSDEVKEGLKSLAASYEADYAARASRRSRVPPPKHWGEEPDFNVTAVSNWTPYNHASALDKSSDVRLSRIGTSEGFTR